MNAPVAALLLICLLAVPARCLGQESTDSTDANLSQEEWRQRVNEARRRSDDFVANARNRKGEPFSDSDRKKEAIERAVQVKARPVREAVVIGVHLGENHRVTQLSARLRDGAFAVFHRSRDIIRLPNGYEMAISVVVFQIG